MPGDGVPGDGAGVSRYASLTVKGSDQLSDRNWNGICRGRLTGE